MAARGSDMVLWIALGIIGACSVYAATAQLRAVRHAARVTEREKSPELINQRTEDALKLETLRELAFGSNQDIRLAALKIIIERVTQDSTYELLLHDVAGKNIEKRDEALVSLKFLSIASPYAVSMIQTYPTMEALVDCLCRLNKNNELVGHDEETNLKVRTKAEKDALNILCNTSGGALLEAIQAGLVSLWLAKYPFGGTNAPESRKIEIVTRLRFGQSDDHAMNVLLQSVNMQPEGRRQLRKYHLMGSAIGEIPDDHDGDILVYQGGSRVHEESAEERALRRRRRQAMVISDGGEPLGLDNIIQGQAYQS